MKKVLRSLLGATVLLFATACSRPVFRSGWIKEKAPDVYTTRFETSKGNFDLEIYREWSPEAADRFYQLVKHRVFDRVLFYRVVPNFVAQFGHVDSIVDTKWDKYKLNDEPVKHGNEKGSLSFARAGQKTRGMNVFINLKNNPRLDTLSYNGVTGFPAFGKVTQGMQTVEGLYSGYADSTMKKFSTLYKNRPEFIKTFPKLDSIYHAYILK